MATELEKCDSLPPGGMGPHSVLPPPPGNPAGLPATGAAGWTFAVAAAESCLVGMWAMRVVQHDELRKERRRGGKDTSHLVTAGDVLVCGLRWC